MSHALVKLNEKLQLGFVKLTNCHKDEKDKCVLATDTRTMRCRAVTVKNENRKKKNNKNISSL